VWLPLAGCNRQSSDAANDEMRQALARIESRLSHIEKTLQEQRQAVFRPVMESGSDVSSQLDAMRGELKAVAARMESVDKLATAIEQQARRG
jgi:hypothetical protein